MHLSDLDGDDIHHMSMMGEQGITIDHMLHAHDLLTASNQITAAASSSLAWLGYTAKSLSFSLEYKTKRMEQFYDQIKDASNCLVKYAESEGRTLVHETRTAFKHSFQELQSGFHDELSQFDFDKKVIYRKYGKLARLARETGFNIFSGEEAQRVVRVLKCLKCTAEGIFYLDIGYDMYRIREAYQKHGQWIKILIEDSLEVLVAVGIGIAASLLFTAGGWIAVLGIGAGEAAANIIGDKGIDWLGDSIDPESIK